MRILQHYEGLLLKFAISPDLENQVYIALKGQIWLVF